MELRGKRKLKKQWVVLSVAVLLLAGAYGALIFGTKITINQKEDVVLVNENLALQPASCTIFGKDCSDSLQQETDFDTSVIGTYNVTWKCRLFSILPVKQASMSIRVIDVDPPTITLTNGTVAFFKKGEEIHYPSFEVNDNYNTPDEITTEITGDYDLTKEGTYEGTLRACDVSGNCSSRTLTMVIGDISEEDFEPGNFNLLTYDNKNTCLTPGTEKLSDYAFSKIYLAGDSNTKNIGEYGGHDAYHVIARYALAPNSFDLPCYYGDVQTNSSLPELIRRLQPGTLLLNMGEAEAASGDPLTFAEHYKNCLEELEQVSGNTRIIVVAILPVREGNTEAAATQLQINRANYCLLKMCEENGYTMICADDWLVDSSTGYGYTDYYLDDGYHLSAAHYPAYLEYLQYSLYEE